MSKGPSSIVSAETVAAIDRPAPATPDGLDWRIRPLSDAGGLEQMGVKVREIRPGYAGTHLHFHDTEEEWAYILSGRGRVRIGPLTIPVRPGHFVAHPPGPSPHHFLAEGDEPLVIFEGGERRRDVDSCVYPNLGIRYHKGRDEKIDPAALPAFEGASRQVVHIDDVPEQKRPHPLTQDAIRYQRSVDENTGLQRQAFAWVRLESGGQSTTYHTHESTDEWVYLLSGQAEVRLGHDWHRIGAGDFIAHPAGGPAHVMRALTEVSYLMGGQRDSDDVVTYPEHGMRLTSTGFEKTAR